MFKNYTKITGRKCNCEFKSLSLNGHWNIQSAITRGRKSGIIGEMSIEHAVLDTSGGGRGGHDGRYTVNADNSFTKNADWSEFGKEH